jgi:hypothetical protein
MSKNMYIPGGSGVLESRKHEGLVDGSELGHFDSRFCGP